MASREGHLEVVKLLVEHGADIEATTLENSRPLYVASEYGRLQVQFIASIAHFTQIVEYLLSKGAEVDPYFKSGATPLVIAAQNGHLQVVHILLQYGANIEKAGNAFNIQSFLTDKTGANGQNALHLAAHQGYADICQLLLAHGSNGIGLIWLC